MAAASASAAAFGDEQVAMKEVTQVYELIKTHQPLLLHRNTNSQQLVYSLLTEAMRALNVALSVMKHLPPASAAAIPVTMIKAEEAPQLMSSSSSPANSSATQLNGPAAAEGDGDNHVGKARRSAAKRRRINSEDKSAGFQLTTVMPHEDGYQWRKYGEKKIQGTDFTRSYFRCTYRDDKGCQATKQIQQKDDNYPPNIQVTYSNNHTCNSCTNRLIDTNNSPSFHNLTANPNGRPDGDTTICNKMIKQEPQAAWLPPPLTTISNNLDETTASHLCQDVPPSSKIYCTDSAADTCSSNDTSIIYCYTDEFNHQMGQQVETTVMEEPLGLGV